MAEEECVREREEARPDIALNVRVPTILVQFHYRFGYVKSEPTTASILMVQDKEG